MHGASAWLIGAHGALAGELVIKRQFGPHFLLQFDRVPNTLSAGHSLKTYLDAGIH